MCHRSQFRLVVSWLVRKVRFSVLPGICSQEFRSRVLGTVMRLRLVRVLDGEEAKAVGRVGVLESASSQASFAKSSSTWTETRTESPAPLSWSSCFPDSPPA